MRDLDKERELLEKAGLAGAKGDTCEALAATVGGASAAVEAKPTTKRARAARNPVGGHHAPIGSDTLIGG